VEIWLEERKQQKELREETRRLTTNVGMKPVDEATRYGLRLMVISVYCNNCNIALSAAVRAVVEPCKP